MSGIDRLLWALARPRTAADRRRSRQVSLGVAGAGVLGLAGFALVGIPSLQVAETLPDGTATYWVPAETGHLSRLTADAGLRHGVETAAVLLAIPFVLFVIQALRTGTAARERRLAGLSLAGATRPQLRRLAALEGARSAVLGALAAGPVYLGCWLVGSALPTGARLLPTPGRAVLLGWPVLVVLLGTAGAVAAAVVAGPAMVSPLGITRRRPRPLSRLRAVLLVAALALVVAELPLIYRYAFDGPFAAVFVLFAVIVVLVLNGGPWLVLLVGRLAVRRDLVTAMAGRRLLADVRSPGRAVSVLFAVGGVLGVICFGFRDILHDNGSPAFALGVFGAVLAGGVVASVMATLSLLVGVTEQILDGRRANATLVALAASPAFVHQVVRRQLLLAAVSAAVTGALFGWSVAKVLQGADWFFPPWDVYLVSLPIAMVLAGLAATLAALVAARAVAPTIDEACATDNLRTG
jgi:hypothetical protein